MEPSLRSREDRVGVCQLLKWPDEKPNSRKANRLFEVEAAARVERSKGRRCGENTLGERRKDKGKWRETVNVQKLDKIRSEGLEAWDQVSHFSAKKLYLYKTGKRTDGKIGKNELVATVIDLYKNECNIGSLDDLVLTGFSDEDSEEAGDGVVVKGSD